MGFIFKILYLTYFISLNYTIYKFLNVSFMGNRKQIIYFAGSFIPLILIHKYLYIKEMINLICFVLLIFFSLSPIIMYFMNKDAMKLIRKMVEKNPDLNNSKRYDSFNKSVEFQQKMVMPIMLTLFQVLMIISPALQKAIAR